MLAGVASSVFGGQLLPITSLRELGPRGLLSKDAGDAIGGRLYSARALSSAVEHTLYTGGGARSIRAAPTIVLERRALTARKGPASQAANRILSCNAF